MNRLSRCTAADGWRRRKACICSFWRTIRAISITRVAASRFKLDGKSIYKDPQGPNGLGQTVAMWLVDKNTLYRERSTKGVIDERRRCG